MPTILGITASQISGRLTPPWSPQGGFDALASVTVPSGGAASITFDGIPTGYKHLQVRALSRSTNSLQYSQIFFLVNNISGSYYRHLLLSDAVNAPGAYGYTAQSYASLGYLAGGNAISNNFGAAVLDIPDYANPNKSKTYKGLFGANNNSQSSPDTYMGLVSGTVPTLEPITKIVFTPESGIFAQYTSFALYGIK
jgi:hypothetical protein